MLIRKRSYLVSEKLKSSPQKGIAVILIAFAEAFDAMCDRGENRVLQDSMLVNSKAIDVARGGDNVDHDRHERRPH